MSARAPAVSICLPVYNGENFVRQAIESILAQTFEDIELVISDNASTDGTAEVCRLATARDRRIRYFRAEVNRGLAWNHNRAFELATGTYSCWIGHDDVIHPNYIELCHDALESDPGMVICFSYERRVDSQGSLIKEMAVENYGESERPSERFRKLLRLDHACTAIFGLMRRAVLQQTRLHGPFAGSDRVLLAEMGLRGRFGLIPEYLFTRHIHSQRTSTHISRRERTLIFDPSKSGKMFFPFLLKARHFASSIRRSPVTGVESLLCYRHLLNWLWTYREVAYWDIREGIVLELERRLPAEHFNGIRRAKTILFGKRMI